MRSGTSLRLGIGLFGTTLALALSAAEARGDAEIPIVGPGGAVLVNAVTNRIYTFGGGVLTEVAGDTHAVRSIDGLPPDLRLGLDEIHNRIYGISPADGTLTVIDGRDLAAQSLALGADPGVVSLDRARDLAWVVNRGDRTVSRVSGGASVTTIDPPGTAPLGATAVDPVAGRYYVELRHADSMGDIGEPLAILEIDEETGAQQTLLVDVSPNYWGVEGGLVLNPLTRRLYARSADFAFSLPFHYPVGIDIDAAAVAAFGATVFDHDGFAVLACDVANDRVFVSRGYNEYLEIRALAGADLAAIDGSEMFAAVPRLTFSPATNRLYATSSQTAIPGVDELLAKDLDALTPAVGEAVPGWILWGGIAVNAATNRVYASARADTPPPQAEALFERVEDERRPIPITTSLWNESPQPNGDVVVHFSASSAFAPNALPIHDIFHQVDAIDGPWSPATPDGGVGTATLSLAPGAHTVHAFGFDGQAVGPQTALEVRVAAPEPHPEIAVASAWAGESIPRTGAFPFQLSLRNATGGPQTFAFLLQMQVPGFGTVTLLPATGMQLPNGVGFAAAVHLPLGAFLPPGTYTLAAVVFQAGGGIVDQSSLAFDVE